MKKIVILMISLHFIVVGLLAQNSPTPEEKKAAYIKAKTEEEVRKLFNSNGYKVGNVLKGYPACLDGYVFYSDMINIPGEEPMVFPASQKVFAIEKGKIISYSDTRLSCEIVFTLNAKDKTFIDNDVLIFIGDNSMAYIYSVFKFDKLNPISLGLGAALFSFNEVKSDFVFITTGNTDHENNRNYDFSGFANSLTCTSKKAYDYVGPTANMFGLRMIILNGKWGYIDDIGKEIVPPKYEDQWDFSEDGLSKVKLGGKWGYVDKAGQEVIPPKYEDSRSFFEGLACVKQNGKWGYVDKTGQEVIPLQYDDAGNFKGERAIVKIGGKEYNIDKTGKEINP